MKLICIFAFIGIALAEKENLISSTSTEADNDKIVRNRVAVGDKELSSAEALELLSGLAKNVSQNKGTTDQGSLPVLPPQGPIGVGGEIENPNPSGRMRCQDDKTKRFIVTARACTDARGPQVCESLFAAPNETTGRRDPKCDQPGYEDIAKSCRKQCAICCEDMNYSCDDDESGIIDCRKNKDKCNVPKWFELLSTYCAGTCGLCMKVSCRDINADCRTMKGVCTNPEQKATMQKQCARTCGFCIPGVTSNPIVNEIPAPAPSAVKPPAPATGTGTGNCVDVGKNCSERANLCGHPLYMEYMKKLCPKTCNTCGAHIPLATACNDAHPKCREWVDTGFCANQYYTTEYKKKNCAKSCKLC